MCRHPGILEEEQLTGAKIYHTDHEAMHHRKSTKCKRPRSLNDLTQELSLLMLPKILLWSAISYLSFMMCEYTFLAHGLQSTTELFIMCEQYFLGWAPTLVTQILTFRFKRTKSWNFQALKILKWICLAAASTKLKTGWVVSKIQLLLEISFKK